MVMGTPLITSTHWIVHDVLAFAQNIDTISNNKKQQPSIHPSISITSLLIISIMPPSAPSIHQQHHVVSASSSTPSSSLDRDETNLAAKRTLERGRRRGGVDNKHSPLFDDDDGSVSDPQQQQTTQQQQVQMQSSSNDNNLSYNNNSGLLLSNPTNNSSSLLYNNSMFGGGGLGAFGGAYGGGAYGGAYGGGGFASPLSSLMTTSPMMMMNMYGAGAGAGAAGPLSSLNQSLFTIQAVLVSLGQAVQIIGMNTQALHQVVQSITTMFDHAATTFYDMQAKQQQAQSLLSATTCHEVDESNDMKRKRRRLQALRWALVVGVTYAAYRLMRRVFLGRRPEKRLYSLPLSSYSASPPHSPYYDYHNHGGGAPSMYPTYGSANAAGYNTYGSGGGSGVMQQPYPPYGYNHNASPYSSSPYNISSPYSSSYY